MCVWLQWLCIVLVVLATFPALVTAPKQMVMLWEADQTAFIEALADGHPLCTQFSKLEGLDEFLACKQEQDHSSCVTACVGEPACIQSVFALVSAGAAYCNSMADAICESALSRADAAHCTCLRSIWYCFSHDERLVSLSHCNYGVYCRSCPTANNYVSLGSVPDHVWFPFAFYVPYVKSTLQVFKVPIVAVAVIICVFGTGLMFLDTMSPSRTKLTMAMHILVVPLCSLPFILLHTTYPTVVPVEET